ncbi:MAG: hypothetical protein FGM32_09210 [Candidatus Kapabacteria bacterium]|nr:hypothetical protein [Candidatus Kapabacteria bacterium]
MIFSIIQLVVISLILTTSAAIDAHLGVYKGVARNASGPLQLGNTTAVTTIFQLQTIGDSLHLRANARGGSNVIVASWPLTRVSCTTESLNAKGLPKGPLHLRRSMQWSISGGIRVSATVTTHGASQTTDDFFGGAKVMLTLVRVK